MKTILLNFTFLFFAFASFAQVEVTFQVDMSDETISENGVHVMGDWQAIENNTGNDWIPGDNEMLDEDGDGIYALTVTLPPGTYNFQFVNGNQWGNDEVIPTINELVGARFFTISSYHQESGLLLPAVRYAGSASEGHVALRLEVDMNNETLNPAGAHLSGVFNEDSLAAAYYKMAQYQPGKFVIVLDVEPETIYGYRFVNGVDAEETVPADCAVDGLRQAEVGTTDLSKSIVCFSACFTCDYLNSLVPVTFQAGMSQETIGIEGVFVTGDFETTEMNDDDADGVYTATIMLPDSQVYNYKFLNGANLEEAEVLPEDCSVSGFRQIAVEEDSTSVQWCFGTCDTLCPLYPPATLTNFVVNMGLEEISPEGVWLEAGFTDPAWEEGAVEMLDDNGDGIYEVTLPVGGPEVVIYKFRNGSTSESADFEEAGCGVEDEQGNFYRVFNRSGESQQLDTVCFNECVNCVGVGIAENKPRVNSVYPNPASEAVFIQLSVQDNNTVVRIYDITGKMVRKPVEVSSALVKIERNGLEAGVYFLEIIPGNGETQTQRVVFK